MSRFKKRLGKIEKRHKQKGTPIIAAELLTNSELQELLEKKETGGEVKTKAYGLLVFDPHPAIIGAGYPREGE